MGFPSPYREHRELGRVKRCPGCREWWPADAEFYYPRQSRCIACCLEAQGGGNGKRRSMRDAAEGVAA